MVNNTWREQMLEAGAWQDEHVELASGRHTDAWLDLDVLFKRQNTMRLRSLSRALLDLVGEDYDTIAPLSAQATHMLHEVELPGESPQIFTSRRSAQTGVYFFPHPASKVFLRRREKLVVFDGVIDDSDSPLRIAEAIREISPEVQLALAGLWRRAELDERYDEVFVRQVYLIDEEIPSWSAEECENCPIRD